MNISIINPITYPGWNDLLLSNREHSFFHTSNWANVLAESYGYKPLYFSYIDGNKLSCLIPLMEIKSCLTGKRGVSLPFTDYCEPVISRDINFQDIFDFLTDWGKRAGWKYIEIRGGHDHFKKIPSSSYCYGHTLNLSMDKDQIFLRLRDSTRRNIRKAIKAGVTVIIDNSLKAVKEFCRLNCMTRKIHGLPPQPFSFFKNIYNHVLAKNHGIVATAYYEGKPISSSVYFHFGKKAVYKYGASDRNFQHLRANNAVMWEAVKYYCSNGYLNLCFGRTEIEHKGLMQFKDGWGTDERIIKYYKYDVQKETFIQWSSGVTDFSKRTLKRMPVPVLKFIGSALSRHMG